MKNSTSKRFLCVFSALCALQLIATSQYAAAQSAPSSSEIENYEGLHKAAHLGQTEIVKKLIASAADIEARDDSARTPLIIAAFASHDDVVKVLADAGADLNAFEHRDYDIVTIAAVADDLALLDLALDLGASAGNITSPYEGTALIAAAHLGHHQVVKRLIESKAPLDHINNIHWTALIESVVLGDGGAAHVETARLLVNAGADQSIGDSNGVTAREHAEQRGFKEMLQLFD